MKSLDPIRWSPRLLGLCLIIALMVVACLSLIWGTVPISLADLPALLHGCYDYIATIESVHYGWLFAAFVAVLFTVAFILVKRQSRRDRYLNNYDAEYL